MAGNEYFHMILQRLKLKQTSIFVHVRISNLKRWYLYKRFLYLVHYFIYDVIATHITTIILYTL